MASSGPHEGAPVLACIVGSCHIRLWRITSRERLARQLRDLGVERLAEREEAGRASGMSVLLLRADYLFDKRVLASLIHHPGSMLEIPGETGERVRVAAHVSPEQVEAAARALETPISAGSNAPPVEVPSGLTIVQLAHLAGSASSYDDELLKAEASRVLRISSEDRRALERRLFDGSYKGITDLVTKWVWPRPALWV